MVTLKEVERQLKAIGANFRFWGRPEILELPHILVPGEKIMGCVNGRYAGGFATFCATDQRLLLIDKKLFYLTVEDLRFDMINEVDYSAQLVTGTMSVCTPTKTMTFTTLHPNNLRQLATYIQQRVMQIRQEFGLHLQSQSSDQESAKESSPSGAMSGPLPDPAPAEAIQEAKEEAPEKLMPQPIQHYLNEVAEMQGPASDPPAQPKSPPEPAMPPPESVNFTGQTPDNSSAVEITELPTPRRRNPYMGAPLMMRRRIGRFGPIAMPLRPPNAASIRRQ